MLYLYTIQIFIQTFEHIDHCQIYHSSFPHLLFTRNFECSHLSRTADKLLWWAKEWSRWCFKCTDIFLSKRRIRERLFIRILLIQTGQCGVDSWWAEGWMFSFLWNIPTLKALEAESCNGAQFFVLKAADIYDPSFNRTLMGWRRFPWHMAHPCVTAHQHPPLTPDTTCS